MEWAYFFVGLAIIAPLVIAIAAYSNSREQRNSTETLWKSEGCQTTKKIDTLLIDDKRRQWTVLGCTKIYTYSDIIDFEISENGKSYKSKNGVIRAVAGGALFGAAGAIVGASTAQKVQTINSMAVKIFVRDNNNPMITIPLVTIPVQTDSAAYSLSYNVATQIIAQLSYMRDVAHPTSMNMDYDIPCTDKKLNKIHTKIVGVTKNNDDGMPIQSILKTLSPSDKIILVREPDNPYDKNAIKVICEYQHIGYIQSDLAETLAPLMDSGKQISASITGITGGTSGKSYGCNILITK